MPEPLVYIDGEFYSKSSAKVSVLDHGFLYGDGVFEGIRCYNGVVFKLREHVERLYRSAKAIRLEIPVSMGEMMDIVVKTIKVNGFKDAYVRLVVTRGVGDLGLDPRRCSRPSIIVIAEQLEPILGSKSLEQGVKLIISSTRRDPVYATSHEVKSLNYLNSIMAKLEAIAAGADDAVMLDSRGFVSEATAANIFIAKSGELATPPNYSRHPTRHHQKHGHRDSPTPPDTCQGERHHTCRAPNVRGSLPHGNWRRNSAHSIHKRGQDGGEGAGPNN
jgi:branched-chain amino acid aminotransferase